MSGQWWRYPSGTVRQRMLPGYENMVAAVVVIDPEDRNQVERLLSTYLDHGFRSTPKDAPIRTTGIDYLQAALREFADPKPPKPAEPTGLGAVVEDADGGKFIRASRYGWWRREDGFGSCNWAAVKAVRVLSEGVSS